MVCYIPPLSHQLGLEKQKNDRLEREIGVLKHKVQDLEQQLSQALKDASGPSNSDACVEVTEQAPAPGPAQKSYLRPTVSSSIRSKLTETVDERMSLTTKAGVVVYYKSATGRIYTYDDGRLVHITHRTGIDPRKLPSLGWYDTTLPGFLKDTKSSLSKRNWSHLCRRPVSSGFQDESTRDTLELVNVDQYEPLKGYEPPEEEPDQPQFKSLEKETRFDDGISWSTGARNVFIPNAEGYRLLGEALNLAKGAFYDICKMKQRRIYRRRLRGGRQKVRFEYDTNREHYYGPWIARNTPNINCRLLYLALDMCR
ncbi:hypothetical protein PG995_003243 [Apiospora arundinis]